MATVYPCQICEQVLIADWMLTAVTEDFGWPPGTTYWVCNACIMTLFVERYQQIVDAMGSEQPASPDGPGVLERVESDDGEVRPAARSRRSRKSQPQAVEEQPAQPAEETEAADDVS